MAARVSNGTRPPLGGAQPLGEGESEEPRWDRAGIIGAVQRFRDREGRLPVTRELRASNGLPSLKTLCRHFGSSDAAFEAASSTEAARAPDHAGAAEFPDERGAASVEGYNPSPYWAPRGTWSKERVIDALRDWARTFGEPPRRDELTSSGADWLPEPYAGRSRAWMREYPRWPGVGTVVDYFGAWSDALRAAGLSPRNDLAFDLPLVERVEAARRMSAAGHSAPAIAGHLGVSPSTVRSYLRAGVCPDCGGPVITSYSERCVTCAHRLAHPPGATREELIERIRDWTRETGDPPRIADWEPTPDRSRKWGHEYPKWPSQQTVLKVFGGSWNAALAAAGCSLANRRWDRPTIVAALRSFAREHGRSPTTEELKGDPGLWPHPGVVRRHFGSFRETLEAAGLEVREPWSPDKVTHALRDFAYSHGRPPHSTDLGSGSDPPLPSNATIRRWFDSLGAALEAAGIRPSRKRWTRGEILAAIRRYRDEHGRFPNSTEFDAVPGGPSHGVVHARFGSWRGALEAAGQEVGS